MYVPVVDQNQKPLMPTIPSRARKWIKSGKATPFWKKGVFSVRLNVEPSDSKIQEIAVGVDPGSKKEGFTVKSELHTYLNIQTDAVTWVKDAVKTRSQMRRTRRGRNCPHRLCRPNRNIYKVFMPPSTKARWQWKLRILNWLKKIYPITCVVVEDIKAWTYKNARKWNVRFSPLEVSKQWFYDQINVQFKLETKQGYETKQMRDEFGLKKSSNKLSNKFNAHCVDSWVLANWFVGGHTNVDNKDMLLITPIQFHRRMLHALQPVKGNIRRPYGGTRSLSFKRGSLVEHIKYGLCFVGGFGSIRLWLVFGGITMSTNLIFIDVAGGICQLVIGQNYRNLYQQPQTKESTNQCRHFAAPPSKNRFLPFIKSILLEVGYFVPRHFSIINHPVYCFVQKSLSIVSSKLLLHNPLIEKIRGIKSCAFYGLSGYYFYLFLPLMRYTFKVRIYSIITLKGCGTLCGIC